MIGQVSCDITDVGYNYLICRPPEQQPEYDIDPQLKAVPLDVCILYLILRMM